MFLFTTSNIYYYYYLHEQPRDALSRLVVADSHVDIKTVTTHSCSLFDNSQSVSLSCQPEH